MTRRELLGNSIRFMLIFGLFAFVFVLFRSLSGPSLTTQSANAFDDVQIGETTIRRIESTRVWVTRLSPMLRNQLSELDQLVVNSNSGCALDADLCVVLARTERSGIELVFSIEHPIQLASGIKWYGGFVNPSNGAVYDRLGRAYKSLRQTNRADALEIYRLSEG